MTLLEIIANSEKEKRQGKVLNYTDNNPLTDYSAYTDNKDKFSRIELTNPVHITDRVTDIGSQRLSDIRDFNLFQPQGEYELIDNDFLPIGILDTPNIEEIAEPKYFEDITYNEYFNIERNIIEIPEPLKNTQYGNYRDKIQSILQYLDSRTVVDVFLGTQQGEDSQIGIIGRDAARAALQLNFRQNLEQAILGKFNTRLIDILQDKSILNKDFTITTNPNPIVRSVEILQKLQGVTLPFNFCPPDMFDLENNENTSTIDRESAIFSYTGRGVRGIIKSNLDRNQYRPIILDNEFQILPSYYVFVDNPNAKVNTYEFNAHFFDDLTAFGDNPVDAIFPSYYGVEYLTKDPNRINPDYINVQNLSSIKDENEFDWEITDWSKNSANKFLPKTLLYKTKQLSIANEILFIDSFKREYILEKNGEKSIISKGNTITSKGAFTYDDDVKTEIRENEYFRAFHKGFKYNQLSRALRHRGLDSNEKRTVLGKNGIPYFMPTIINRGDTPELVKRTFFSIENLAWKNNIADLPPCERGNPDINGNLGRWMAFPPYNLRFNESVSVDWKDYSFISRGEPLFTYNNTTRAGRLSFNMLVDHPDIVNKARGQASQLWERYFAGDKSVQREIDALALNRLSPSELEQLSLIKRPPIPQQKKVDGDVVSNEDKKEAELEENVTQLNNINEISEKLMSVYFPNEVTVLPDPIGGLIQNNAGYEAIDQILDVNDPLYFTYLNGIQRGANSPDPYENQFNYGLNNDFYNNANSLIKSKVESIVGLGSTGMTIHLHGFASKAIGNTPNDVLALKRANSVKTWIENKLNELGLFSYNLDIKYEIRSFSDLFDSSLGEGIRKDNRDAKEARRVSIFFIPQENNPELNDTNQIKDINDIVTDPQYISDFDEFISVDPPELSAELYEKLFYSECDWFEELKIIDPIKYQTISENVRYFHPAYHSLTPSTFHKRLTFLHQCTRQGSSEIIESQRPNMAFGTQPLLKLMIGDFFYTYFIIKSLGIEYDIDNGPIWDTNPEGIGVQPMICKVDMDIVILGSQSLSSPINRLNNALSFNFYANTTNYDARANDVVFRTIPDAKPNEPQFEAEIIEGLRLSQVYNKDRSLTNIETIDELINFRNYNREDIINAQQPNNEIIDNIELNIENLRNENIKELIS